jgi:hypothetical protein
VYIARGSERLRTAEISWTLGFSPRVRCPVVEPLNGAFAVHGGPVFEAPCAITLLGADGATVAEVADAGGDRSTDAVARASRDAGRAAPSAVQERLQAAQREGASE